MEEDALFNLRWDAQRTSLLGSVSNFYQSESFVDTSLVADGQIFKAHKLILSASSSHLKNILESVEQQHAVLFLPPSVKSIDLHNVLKFIYGGEIKINRRELKSFLEAAKLLRIKGMDFDLEEELNANVLAPSHPPPPPTTHPPSSSGPMDDEGQSSMSSSKNLLHTKRLSLAEESISPLNLHTDRGESPKEGEDGGGGQNQRAHHSSGTGKSVISCTGSSSTSAPSDLPYPGGGGGSERRGSGISSTSIRDVRERLISETLTDATNEDSSDMVIDQETVDHRLHMSQQQEVEGGGNEIEIGKGDRKLSISEYKLSEGEGEEHHGRHYIEEEEEDGEQGMTISLTPEVSLREEEVGGPNPHHGIQITSVPKCTTPHSFVGRNNLGLGPGLSLGSRLKPLVPTTQMSLTSTTPNEGILMRMMREPLQSATVPSLSMTSKMSATPNPAFFGLNETAPPPAAGHHHGGSEIRKLKRFVQCSNCSKVLSSLSALKRHMEDVHCARIQGKCIICGRIYSSRNSLLTHVYSAHKLHHDYKAVARIIRESDFEKFASGI